MNYTEQAALFDCAGDTLLGILARPETPAQTGVVVIVGGPQYRVGSHRQFVLLSRALATAGYAVLRFDYRGMGDSEGDQRNFEAVSADISAAICALQECVPSIENVVLWGLCDAASAALLYCDETNDLRVTGLCLLNPWVRSEASLARTQVKHYYSKRLMQNEFWLKLIRGKVAFSALNGLIQKIRISSSVVGNSASEIMGFQQRMAMTWHQFPGPILLILSGDDYTAKEFMEFTGVDRAWKNYSNRANLTIQEVPGADHTFSGVESQQQAELITLKWISTLGLQ